MKNRVIRTILILFCVILNNVYSGCADAGPLKLENWAVSIFISPSGIFWILGFSSATALL